MKFDSVEVLNDLFPKGTIIITRWYGNHRCIIKVDRFERNDNGIIQVIGDGLNTLNEFKFSTKFCISDNDVSYASDREIECFSNMFRSAINEKLSIEDNLINGVMTKIGILVKDYGYNISININKD